VQIFENGLLDRSRDEFELLASREADELRRLAEDRNRCAHPGFHGDGEEPFEMTAEQVRAYARLVVEAVLSQAPVVGKALVERFIADTRSTSWPDEALVDFLRTRYFERARRGSMRNIVIVAVKAAIRPPDGDNQVAGRCVATLTAAAQIDEQLVLGAISDVLFKWRDHLSDADLARAVGAIGSFKAGWEYLGEDNVARVRTLLANMSIEALIENRVFASGPPAEPTLLADYGNAIQRLTLDQLDELTKERYPAAQWVPSVLDQIDAVASWRGGERAMRMALRVAGSMTVEDLDKVASAFVANSQINQASDMPQLIELMVSATAGIIGSRQVWKSALDSYAATYQSHYDPSGYYSYAETRNSLSS
jgi:hypothetical protein